MYSDYHVHSNFSFDSDETLENIIEKAVSLKMPQVAITDHYDIDWPVPGEIPSFNIYNYSSLINAMREKYADKIHIIKGIELGLMESTGDKCRNLINYFPFDFVIGSCHIVDNMDPYYSQFWENRKDRAAFELYFDTLLASLKSFNGIDALGHMDYIVRYSPNKDSNYSVSDYSDIIDTILIYIISHDIKLEINTSNYANGFNFPNPHTDIIRRYKELGGTYVTIGSDSHTASTLGYEFHRAADLISKYNLKVFTIQK
jgi:histidinol-phosphatase (PHP family)